VPESEISNYVRPWVLRTDKSILPLGGAWRIELSTKFFTRVSISTPVSSPSGQAGHLVHQP